MSEAELLTWCSKVQESWISSIVSYHHSLPLDTATCVQCSTVHCCPSSTVLTTNISTQCRNGGDTYDPSVSSKQLKRLLAAITQSYHGNTYAAPAWNPAATSLAAAAAAPVHADLHGGKHSSFRCSGSNDICPTNSFWPRLYCFEQCRHPRSVPQAASASNGFVFPAV